MRRCREWCITVCKCRLLLMNQRSSISEGNKWTDRTCFFLLADPVRNDKQQMTRDWDNGGLEVPLLNVIYWWGLLHWQFPYSNRIRISVIFVHFSTMRPGMENFLGNWAKQAVKISQVISVKPYFQLHSYTSSNASNQFILMVVITVYLYRKGHLLHFQRSIV